MAAADSFTWAEWAWLFVGSYWIVLGLFVIPSRLHDYQATDVVIFGLVPIVVAVVLRRIGTKAPAERSTTIWTHLAAVGLLATWPFAWACIIILGRRLH
jgi:chromate transport protein ChrA